MFLSILILTACAPKGDDTATVTPVTFGPGTTLATGSADTCAIYEGGLACWGALSGDTPTAIMEDVDAMALGDNHACALDTTGQVTCWGRGREGQIGNGAHEPHNDPTPAMGGARKLAAGAFHTCATDAAGTAWCWGNNDAHQVSQTDDASLTQPTAVEDLAGVIDLALGADHSCALRTDGSVWCWGADSVIDDPRPQAIDHLPDIAELASGWDHMCARDTWGTVSCWGDNSSGQLGPGAEGAESSEPVEVDLPGAAQTLGAGADTSCASLDDGTVWCWGGAGGAQPWQVTALSGVTQVSAHLGGHACAVTGEGAVWCWGSNESGQVGDGSREERGTPVKVGG